MPLPSLTLVEELALLALDEKTGKPINLPIQALGYGLAGAIILDLSLAGRVDTDLHQLTVTNPSPTDDPLLDGWLKHFRAAPRPLSVMAWLRDLAPRQEEIHQAAVERLIQRGLLRREEKRLFWGLSVRRYPAADGAETKELRTRLTDLILGNDLPAPRDAIFLSLIQGCRLTDHFFADLNLEACKTRIETLASTELVGREISAATVASLDAVGRAFSEMAVSL